MASNPDFVQFVADQCAGAGEITFRKMFGDYGIYCNGKIFGLICDDRFYVKPTAAGGLFFARLNSVRHTMVRKIISTSRMSKTTTISHILSVRRAKNFPNLSQRKRSERAGDKKRVGRY